MPEIPNAQSREVYLNHGDASFLPQSTQSTRRISEFLSVLGGLRGETSD
jgi:hypothetical protein